MRLQISFRQSVLSGVALIALATSLGSFSTARAEAAAADSAAIGLEEVIVTAQKRSENLQKTPISVSVVTAQAMEDRHIYSLTELNDGSAPV